MKGALSQPLASHVADRDDLVAADTAGRLHFSGVALFPPINARAMG